MKKMHYLLADSVLSSLTGDDGQLVVNIHEPGAKRHFVKLNEAAFVAEIKKRPILYDITHKDFKRFNLRKDAWTEVAQIMQLSVQECKKRWRSMRDSFLKTLRTKGEQGSRMWLHYRLLEFLLPFVGAKYSNKYGHAYIETGFDVTDDSTDIGHDFDYLDLDRELDLYGDEPVTVSYVTEDGKEMFQILHRPAGSALTDNELLDDDDDGTVYRENDDNAQVSSLLRSYDDAGVVEGQQQEHPEHTQPDAVIYEESSVAELEEDSEVGSVVYEERVDATMPGPSIEADSELIWKSHIEEPVQQDADTAASAEYWEESNEIEEVPTGKRRRLDSKVHRSATHDAAESYFSYQMAEVLDHSVSVPQKHPASHGCSPPKQLAATPAPAAVSSPPSHTRDEEESSRYAGSKEPDARLGITDPDERFLLSCAPLLRRLPFKKNVLARLRIQQLLYEMAYNEKYDGV